ncbi:MAG: hypothetical protein M1833_003677 [Piccolia ochrophora]|nr:MAG: hypothetical protein M1833_003677 [Piccolia ochrophora]
MGTKRVVLIAPVITRLDNGAIIPELGAGTGGLNQNHDLELPDAHAVDKLLQMCQGILEQGSFERVRSRILSAFSNKGTMSLKDSGLDLETDIPLEELAQYFSKNSGLQRREPRGEIISDPIFFDHDADISSEDLPKSLDLQSESSIKVLFDDLCFDESTALAADLPGAYLKLAHRSDDKRDFESYSSENHSASISSPPSPRHDSASPSEYMTPIQSPKTFANVTQDHYIARSVRPRNTQGDDDSLLMRDADSQHIRTCNILDDFLRYRSATEAEQSATMAQVELIAPSSSLLFNDVDPRRCLWGDCNYKSATFSDLHRHVESTHNFIVFERQRSYRCNWSGCSRHDPRSMLSRKDWESHMYEHYTKKVPSTSMGAHCSGDGTSHRGKRYKRDATKPPSSECQRSGNISMGIHPFLAPNATEEWSELIDTQSSNSSQKSGYSTLKDRAQAYATALGEGSQSWATQNPMVVGNNHASVEVVL